MAAGRDFVEELLPTGVPCIVQQLWVGQPVGDDRESARGSGFSNGYSEELVNGRGDYDVRVA